MPTTPADTPPPEVEPEGTPTEPATPAAPDQPQPDQNGWGADGTDGGGTPVNWLYSGPDRIYSNVPVTATAGTILAWPSDPGMGDGCWTVTDQAANTLPDNHRPEPTEAEAARLRGDADTPKEG